MEWESASLIPRQNHSHRFGRKMNDLSILLDFEGWLPIIERAGSEEGGCFHFGRDLCSSAEEHLGTFGLRHVHCSVSFCGSIVMRMGISFRLRFGFRETNKLPEDRIAERHRS